MEKPICLITGATEGVGNFTALELAKRRFAAGGRAFMGLRPMILVNSTSRASVFIS